jgi:hypothetical protein
VIKLSFNKYINKDRSEVFNQIIEAEIKRLKRRLLFWNGKDMPPIDCGNSQYIDIKFGNGIDD